MSKDFAIWMKSKRIKKSMSQERLAEKVGVHMTSIARWETGTQFPTLDMAEKIIETLGGVLIVGETNSQGRKGQSGHETI